MALNRKMMLINATIVLAGLEQRIGNCVTEESDLDKRGNCVGKVCCCSGCVVESVLTSREGGQELQELASAPASYCNDR